MRETQAAQGSPDKALIDVAVDKIEELRRHASPTGSSGVVASPQANAFIRETHNAFAGYDLLTAIHRGGQGVVYEALQQATRRKVAIKVMKEGPLGGPAERARFEREIHILGQLKHPNIVTIHESGSVGGFSYFV